MRVIFENEESKDQFLRLAGASTLDDLADFGAIFDVQEDSCYTDFDHPYGLDDLDDLDDFEHDYDLYTGLPF